MKKLIPHKFTISFYIGVKEIIYYTLMAKNNSAENIVLDLVVIPFDQIKNHVILDIFLLLSSARKRRKLDQSCKIRVGFPSTQFLILDGFSCLLS